MNSLFQGNIGTFIVGLSLFSAAPAMASGWVKDNEQYYVKVSVAQNLERDSLSSVLPLTETEQSTNFYAEYGLPTSWKSQLTVFAAHKTIVREEDNRGGDDYTAAALTDTQVSIKNRLFDLSEHSDSPVNILVSGTLGFNLPTTPDEFAIGNEDQRSSEIALGKTELLSTIDKGSTGLIAGIGASAFYQGVWLNIGFTQISSLAGDWDDQKIDYAIGVGLPFNSWIQAGYTKLASNLDASFLTAGSQLDPVNDENEQISVSIGATVWQGLAIEAGWTDNRNLKNVWSDWETYTFGLSYRTI